MTEGCAFLSGNKRIHCSHVMKKQYKTVLFLFLLAIILCYLTVCAWHASGYVPDVYVCRHMARDLEDSFESVGFDVKIIHAKNIDDNRGHLWISINGLEIDSITLLPMSLIKLSGKNYVNIGEYDDYMSWAKDCHNSSTYQELLIAGEL